MKKIIACLLLVLVAGYGCSFLFGPKQEKTAAELVEQGREEFADEDYKKAIEAYRKLKDWYPFSQYAKEAELKIADAHYRLKEYEQAISAYEEFERLHPSDPKIAYVVYYTGRCYFDRMKGIDRDQSFTEKALQVFKQLRRRFPESEYAEKAESHIRKCLKTLAGHDFYVGEFYYKQDHYKAALARFEDVVNNYPPEFEELRERARDYIERCREHIKARSEAEATAG